MTGVLLGERGEGLGRDRGEGRNQGDVSTSQRTPRMAAATRIPERGVDRSLARNFRREPALSMAQF